MRLEAFHPGPQELFYHAEPLDVAKHLTGRETCQRGTYKEAETDAYTRKVSEQIQE